MNSLLRQTLPPVEVILVVDHNPDLLQRAKQTWRNHNVKVVDNQRTRGSSGAWNAGIDAATGYIVAFIDDDAIAEPDWLEHIVYAYNDATVIGVGGTIEPVWAVSRPVWFPEEFDWVVGCTYKGLPDTTSPVRNLIGCNMSFRRDLLQSVRFYEKHGLGHLGAVPLGCDETELCIRVRSLFPDHQIIYHPPARVRHVVPVARSTFSYFRQRCSLEGRSKAIVSQLTGTEKALSTERKYVIDTLGPGALRYAVRGELRRSAAILVGLALATINYMLGRWREPARGSGE
jgi:glycosyltransferase involved in cell wall biosynthesis